MIINGKHIKIRRFSSGEMKLTYADLVEPYKSLGANILYEGEESVFELYLICSFLRENGIKTKLTLSYLPYQRMDHSNNIEAPTLDYVAKLFNSLKLDEIAICEPHCSLEKFVNAKAINIVKRIFDIFKREIEFDINDTVIFTDKGSKNRYSTLHKNNVYFQKVRDPKTGLIIRHEMVGKILSNKVVIFDDIISSGDTIMSCLEMLPKELEIYIICAHFEKNKYNLRLFDDARVKKVYASNSLSKRGNKKLKLFSVEDLICDGRNNKD
mgnify:CR=1 FL=1